MKKKTTVTRIGHGTLFIGRPGDWGNPRTLSIDTPDERVDCLLWFIDYITTNVSLLLRVGELTGQALECYCTPKLCHGDVLALLADNSEWVVEHAEHRNMILSFILDNMLDIILRKAYGIVAPKAIYPAV